MKEIPTAEELLRKKYKLEGKRGELRIDQVTMFMIEFTKLHLKAQAEAIFEKANKDWKDQSNGYSYQPITKKSIDDAYPLNLVK